MNSSNPRHSDRSRECGMVLIYVAIVTLVLIGVAGLAIDGAVVSSAGQQLQNAADGAALHAARYLASETDPAFPTTRAAAMSLAGANEAAKATIQLSANTENAAGGDIVVGNWDWSSHTFTPSVSNPNAVRVHAVRTQDNAQGPISLMFGPIFGKATSDAGATSTAVLLPPLEPLVLILDPTANAALNINGINSLSVQAGKIQVDSDSDCGITIVGNPVMSALLTRVCGGACYPDGTIQGPLQENAPFVPDPLANVLPTTADWNAFKATLATPLGANGKITTSGTFDPGYYPKGLKVSASEVITLKPGSYMFGGEVTLHGSSFLSGTNVTLFIDKDAEVDVSGAEAGMQLTPPGEGSPFQGISLFTHRESTGSPLVKIAGGGLFKVEGIMYIPSGEIELSGTPGKEIGAILAYTATLHGTTSYTITGKGVPKLTDQAPTAFLVE